LKYSGGAMICGGILLMFCLRAFTRRPTRSRVSKGPTAEGGDGQEDARVPLARESDTSCASA
jgi:hypothetical protein